MKFRTYQLFYILSVALTVATLFMPLMQFVEANGATGELTNFKFTAAEGAVSYAPVALGVVLIVTGVVNLFGLLVSGYQNFELQKRTAILGMLLTMGYYLLLGVYVWVLSGASFAVEIATLFPLFSFILNALSFLAMRRAEASILAKASGFRLRD